MGNVFPQPITGELERAAKARHARIQAAHACLVGATITSVSVEEDDYDGADWLTLHVTPAEGHDLLVQVSRDPEGNGPGHLFIEEAR